MALKNSVHEASLLRLIKDRSLIVGRQMKLASGEVSNYYIDGKLLEVFSEGAYEIGEVLYERTKELGMNAIGGLAVGAVPLVAATVIAYHHHGIRMEGFWVRDGKKDHGTQKLIEGKLGPGDKVVIVDDVVTSGGSVLKAIDAVNELQCKIITVIALVDRERGGREAVEKKGCTYEPIFTTSDLGVNLDSSGRALDGR